MVDNGAFGFVVEDKIYASKDTDWAVILFSTPSLADVKIKSMEDKDTYMAAVVFNNETGFHELIYVNKRLGKLTVLNLKK